MMASTRDAATGLNEKARQRRIVAGFIDDTGLSVTLRSGMSASVGDQVMTRRNDRRNRFSGTDFAKNGDRWTVLEVSPTGALRVQHQRSGKNTWLGTEYVQQHVDHAYAITVHSAQGSTVDVSHVLLDGSEDRQSAYVALSRGRVGNHVYLRSAGDGNPHNVIRPEVIRPSTGAEILTEILGRDGAEQSASTTRRVAASPQQLHQHTLRYLDGVFAAAEDLVGVEQMRLIDEHADQVEPGITSCGGWPLLRMMLAVAHVSGADPMTELGRVRDERPLGDARDVAAVLAWRLDDTALFGGEGPLPWLRAVARPLQDDPTWGPYLAARAERVRTYADQVRDLVAQTLEPPRWVEPVSHNRQLWSDLAVWRAADEIPDTDLVPAGAVLKPSRERNYQQRLEARVKSVAAPAAPLPQAAMQLLRDRAPGVVANPLWPFLARRLSAAAADGHEVVALVEASVLEGPLPDELPAAAFWFRLVGKLPPTTPDTDNTGIRLRPAWTDELLRTLPGRVGEQVLTDPQWAEFVAVVADADRQTGQSETELLHQAVESANLDPTLGGVVGEAVVTTLLWRLEQLLQPPANDDHEVDPAAEHDNPAGEEVDWSPIVDSPIDPAEAETPTPPTPPTPLALTTSPATLRPAGLCRPHRVSGWSS